MILRVLLPLGCAVLAAGCSMRVADAPSLLPRPIEARRDAEPVRVSEPVAPDAALDTAIAQATAALSESAARFDEAAIRAERLAAAARGAAPGTDRWLDAQTALSELDTLRGSAITALADLERLAIERASAGKPAYPALEAAIDRARRRNEQEIERIAAIESRIRPA